MPSSNDFSLSEASETLSSDDFDFQRIRIASHDDFCFPRGWKVRRPKIFAFQGVGECVVRWILIKNIVGKVHDKCPLRSEEEGRGQCVRGYLSDGVSMSGVFVAAFRHGLPWANGVISA